MCTEKRTVVSPVNDRLLGPKRVAIIMAQISSRVSDLSDPFHENVKGRDQELTAIAMANE